VTAILVVLVLTGVVAGMIALIGGGLFALIIVPVGIAVAVWLALAGSRGTRPSEVASREAPQNEFLGPGGPDDPNA
jgi:hypothetical protein